MKMCPASPSNTSLLSDPIRNQSPIRMRPSAGRVMMPSRRLELEREAFLAARSFTSPPTSFPHDIMKPVRLHGPNDARGTQRHFVRACTRPLHNQPISSLYNLNTNLQLTQITCKQSARIHNQETNSVPHRHMSSCMYF